MNKSIEDFKTSVTASFAAINGAVDGLALDIKTLNDKITELQNSPGILNPDDQKTLDDIATAAGSMAERVRALDLLTEPPTAPAPVPTPTGAPENPA